MARRKAKKTVKKSSPSPGEKAKDEAENKLKNEEQAPLVSDEDGMVTFVLVWILFLESGT